MAQLKCIMQGFWRVTIEYVNKNYIHIKQRLSKKFKIF